METNQTNPTAPEGYKPAPAHYFTGNAYVKTLVASDDNTNCSVSDVWFDSGVRNNWHTHPSNQILLVKEGVCYFQEEGQPRRTLSVGEVVNILPGVKHWHGASPDGTMIHTAININTEKGTVDWLEIVTDEQYSGKA